jgi:C-terminal peptidase prc
MYMTKAMLTRSLSAVLGMWALALPLSAAEEVKSSRPYVVLVGISNYADKQIKPRHHAEDDVKALYDLFTDPKYLGADPKHVRLLLGGEDAKRPFKPATRENILESLRWVAGQANSDDLVIFAFVGEGGPLGDRRCYFASDSTFKDRNKNALAAEEIGEALKPLKSRRFCTFLDVDFKGFNAGPEPLAEPSLGKAPYQEFLGDDGSEDHVPDPGRVVFLATNGLSTSHDLKEHGLFTEVLLKGLKGAADEDSFKEGYESDGVVTVDELTAYLDKEITSRTAPNAKTDEDKQQFPVVLAGRATHIVLTKNPAVTAKVKERLDKFAKLVKAGTVPAELATEGATLLERMPRLEAQRNLRKAYQRLVDGGEGEQFQTKRTAILDGMKLGRDAGEEFAQKVLDAIEVIAEGYVKEVNPAEMVSWAIRGLYRRIEEKIPEKIEARLKTVKELRKSDLSELLADARVALGKREDLDKQKDVTITLQRMLSNLDPYTTYIDPETKKKFDIDVQGHFTGIGIQIRKDSASDQLLVVTPIKNSPAYKAGLQAGDLITTITREVDSKGNTLSPPEVLQTKGMSLSKAVENILGLRDTKVKLTLQREGESKPIEVEITRDEIEVESVLGIKRKSSDEWDYWIDPENKIGYIRLTNFARNSYRDMERVMNDLTRRGVKGFILDLRFNPGGLLDSAVKISDLFVDDGLIVSVRPRIGRETKYPGRHYGSLLGFPMVCLVNGYSASGSEIVSAALQDHNRAWIVGERSYGKGSVQNIQPFEGGDIKLTTASFWRPSGRNLNKSSTKGKEDEDWGVIPDQIVKLTSKDREDLAEAQHESEIIYPRSRRVKEKKPEFKDRQLDAALEYLRGKIKMASRAAAKKNG